VNKTFFVCVAQPTFLFVFNCTLFGEHKAGCGNTEKTERCLPDAAHKT